MINDTWHAVIISYTVQKFEISMVNDTWYAVIIIGYSVGGGGLLKNKFLYKFINFSLFQKFSVNFKS